MIDRQTQLKKLYDVIHAIAVSRNQDRPDIVAQFHVDAFMARHKNDRYFDDVLQMEIEDCSRALPN